MTNNIQCPGCDDVFNNTMNLGRHMRRMHRTSSGIAVRSSQSQFVQTSLELIESVAEDDVHWEEEFVNGVADETFAFYEQFQDTTELLFEKEPALNPPIQQLCKRGRALVRFCCMQQSTQGGVIQHYLLETQDCGAEDACTCQNDLTDQFPTARSFAQYVARARRLLVRGQGWRKVHINTLYGMNSTGSFRPIMPIVHAVLAKAGGVNAIIPFQQNVSNGRRLFTRFSDSDTLRLYSETSTTDSRFLCLDLYADGTTLSRSGTQSACVVRLRFSNVRGCDSDWHELGLAPYIRSQTSYTESKLAHERLLLHHRYLHILMRDAIVASKTGFIVDSKLVFIRIGMLVCDQKQERPFLALKSVGSFMDCSMCMLPSRAHESAGEYEWDEIPDAFRKITSDEVYAMQTEKQETIDRNVVSTVSRQLVAAKAARDGAGSALIIRDAKKYLHAVSGAQLPSAFSSFYGLGTAPYLLFKCIGLDRLHAIDLGILRDIPDHAYRLFGSADYNKGLVSRAALVRTANQRFIDLPRQAGVRFTPFRSSPGEAHAGITGAMRRLAAPFLWIALLGLQPQTNPDEDMLLQASLAINELQVLLRGVNLPFSEASRDNHSINNIQRVAFRAIIYLSQSLGLAINTKMHRILHHAHHHLLRFGDARRGDSDINETLHKHTKASYDGTNHRADIIGPQLLSLRTAALPDLFPVLPNGIHATPEDAFCSEFRRLVLRKDPENANTAEKLAYEIPQSEYADTAAHRSALSILRQNLVSAPVDDASSVIMAIRDPISHKPVWRQVSRCAFNAKMNWLSPEHAARQDKRQLLYAGGSVNGTGARYDCVEYDWDGRVHRGFAQNILEGNAYGARFTAVVIRRLRQIPAQAGNTKVVTEYGHLRYAFELQSTSEADIILDVVKLTSLRRTIVAVRDMHDIVTRMGIDKRMNQIEDNITERREARFFAVKGISLSTFE